MLRAQLERLMARKDLKGEEMAGAMEALMEGRVPEAQVAAFLTGLRAKGETVEEIVAAATVMRDKAQAVAVPSRPLLDVVGTGGDGTGTFNISTLSALVAAAGGVAVAKHGNRSVSSRCGSADVLEALGCPLLGEASAVEEAVASVGFGFLFAPHFHRAMKNVAPIRKALGIRTIFNLLGPLTNPARPDRMVVGVFAPHLVRPLAEVLERCGVEKALVVHGAGGADELTLAGANRVCLLERGRFDERTLLPEEAGLPEAPLEAARGGDAAENAALAVEIFEGRRGPARDLVLLNTGAALFVADRVTSLKEGVALAAEVLDDGRAAGKLEDVRAFGRDGEVVA
ncbi:MAG: anthranilate phosphoribosyltransferase [Synergistales bacterium]|nr:anthranilate phosphoribosyltransferase [Synergistales bacterium]